MQPATPPAARGGGAAPSEPDELERLRAEVAAQAVKLAALEEEKARCQP